MHAKLKIFVNLHMKIF